MKNFEINRLDSLEKKFSAKFKFLDMTVNPQTKNITYIIELTPSQIQFLVEKQSEIKAKQISSEMDLSSKLGSPCVGTTKWSLRGNLLAIRGRAFVINALLEMIYNKRI